ncbi:hypothetical protein [Streptomyces althioticus]|uniref:hypothetical protein n=1 Tax=Streptomyces althioticus TaxID=83380 RepID=UPI00343F7F6B
MRTDRLNTIAATGQRTGMVRLADGTQIALAAGPGFECLPCPGSTGRHGVPADYQGPYTHLEVWLMDGVEPGDSDGWLEEDSWELRLTSNGEPVQGRLFYTVPVEDVRKLIEEHGGEHPGQDA